MTNPNKQHYAKFCEKTYVPIFSQPWWLDAVCKPENWDVWLCKHGEEIVAAMPYYFEDRNGYRYITKALLTQNNGIVFAHAENSTRLSRQKAEEKIIDEACEFIASLNLDVYEQQFHHSFENWSTFYWNGYDAIPRYTYVLQDTSDLDQLWHSVSSKQRAIIKKGRRSIACIEDLDPEKFYDVHNKVFERQGLPCPFSKELWLRLWTATNQHGAGHALCARTDSGDIASFIFLVQDNNAMYQLLGGSTPDLQSLDTYDALIWHGIELAHDQQLAYDFEGSMIKRIAKSFREYGGEPKQYFRIRKIFNPEIVKSEAEQKILKLEQS